MVNWIFFAAIFVVVGCGGARKGSAADRTNDVEVRRYEEKVPAGDWTYSAAIETSLQGEKVRVRVKAARYKPCTLKQHKVVRRTITKSGVPTDLGEIDEVVSSTDSRCDEAPAAGANVFVAGNKTVADDTGMAYIEVSRTDLVSRQGNLLGIEGVTVASADLDTVRTQVKKEEEVRQFNEITASEVKSGTCVPGRRKNIERLQAGAEQVLAALSQGTSTSYQIKSRAIFVASPKGQDFPLEKFSTGRFDVLAMGIGVVSIEVLANGKEVATNKGGTSNYLSDLPGVMKAQLFENQKDVYGAPFEAEPNQQYLARLKGEGCNLVLIVERN